MDGDKLVVLEFVQVPAYLSIANRVVCGLLVGVVECAWRHCLSMLVDMRFYDFVEGALGGFE
jgi:hypothetical protein